MRTPADVIKGRVVDYDPVNGELMIKASLQDFSAFDKRKYQKCLIQLLDGRPLSNQQRNTCYKLIREIAEYTGMGLDRTKEELKRKFAAEVLTDALDPDFSLSDASVSVACAFQRWLVRFMLDYDIPSSFPLLEFVDDVHDYLYACLANKKCCICGKPADLHHVERVGMGRSRDDIIHEGMEALPLCRIHHNEDHLTGDSRFFAKYHLDGGIELDGELCDIYRLKRKEEEEIAQQNYYDGPPDERPGTEIYTD